MSSKHDPSSVETNVGWAGMGTNYFRGHPVDALVRAGHGYFSMVSLAVGHRPLRPSEERLLDRLAAATNGSDPRIWPLKFAWLVGSYGGSMSALGSLLLWLGGARVGPDPAQDAARTWLQLAALADGAAIDAWFTDRKARGERVAGFGVPGRDDDERVRLGKQVVEAHGGGGPHYRLLLTVEQRLEQHGRLRPNIVGLVTACALDLGFEPEHMPWLMWPGLEVSVIANAVEASRLQPETIRQLPLDRVRYEGPSARVSPRAIAHSKAAHRSTE